MNPKPKLLFYLLFSFLFFGCQQSAPVNKTEIKASCDKLSKYCDPGCLVKKFRACYIDTDLFPSGPYDLYKHCHGVHVGNTCTPCEQIFSLNFGGSMRPVSCQEFFETLSRKNSSCDNCLKKFGDSPE